MELFEITTDTFKLIVRAANEYVKTDEGWFYELFRDNFTTGF